MEVWVLFGRDLAVAKVVVVEASNEQHWDEVEAEDSE